MWVRGVRKTIEPAVPANQQRSDQGSQLPQRLCLARWSVVMCPDCEEVEKGRPPWASLLEKWSDPLHFISGFESLSIAEQACVGVTRLYKGMSEIDDTPMVKQATWCGCFVLAPMPLHESV